MLTKIAVFLLIIAACWFLLSRQHGARKKPMKRQLPVQDLVRCERCGAFRPAGRPCDCGDG